MTDGSRHYTLKPRRRAWPLGLLAGVLGAVAVIWAVAASSGACRHDPRPIRLGGGDARPYTYNFPLHKSEEDPAAADAGAVDLAGAADFSFVMGEGGGQTGYNVVKLSADGVCQYTFINPAAYRYPDEPYWKRATFAVDAGTVAELRRLLAEIDYWRMKKMYHGAAADGTQWFVKIRAAGRNKGVYCNNHFPDGIQRLSQFVHSRILEPHRAEINKGEAVDLKPEEWEPVI